MTNFKPQYWLYKNIKFPDLEVANVIKNIKKIGKELIDRDEKLISTFYYKDFERPDRVFTERYDEIMQDIVKEQGMFTSTKYLWLFWSQLYFHNGCHPVHNHATHNDESIKHIKDYKDFVSWVHFIKTPNEKCFRFIDKDGQCYYPEEQNNGDLIVFPSYLWHEVTPNISKEERFVTAGNIAFTYMDLW